MLVLPPSFPYGGMENPVFTFATPTIISGVSVCYLLLLSERIRTSRKPRVFWGPLKFEDSSIGAEILIMVFKEKKVLKGDELGSRKCRRDCT